MNFLVVFLDVSGQVAEKGRAHLHDRRAALGGATDLFKIFDLVDGVVVEAGLAEGVLVLTVAEVDLLVLLPAQPYLALADLAGCNVLHAVDGAHESAPDNTADLGLLHDLLLLAPARVQAGPVLEGALQHSGHPRLPPFQAGEGDGGVLFGVIISGRAGFLFHLPFLLQNHAHCWFQAHLIC